MFIAISIVICYNCNVTEYLNCDIINENFMGFINFKIVGLKESLTHQNEIELTYITPLGYNNKRCFYGKKE